jgi:Protein of unknown function (DUF2809)
MSKRYLGLFVALLAVEVFIALVVHDRVVRPFVGDVLVVILIYCFVRIFPRTRVTPTVLAVFVFACAIEVSQAFDLVKRLHVEHIAVLRVALGTHFDPFDFVAYAIGSLIVWLAERRSLDPQSN